MGSMIYVQIAGIKGESTDRTHTGWIEAISFTHSIAVPIITAGGSGGGAGRPQESLSLTKQMDSTSPLLYEACSGGKHIQGVVIDFMQVSGDVEVKYMSAQLQDVLISGIVTTSEPQQLPVERLSLIYSRFTWVPVPHLAVESPVTKLATPLVLKVP